MQSIFYYILFVGIKKRALYRGGSRINFRVLQNFTRKIEHRNDVICRILYIQQEARTYSFDYGMGAELKVKFDSSKKHPRMGG